MLWARLAVKLKTKCLGCRGPSSGGVSCTFLQVIQTTSRFFSRT